MADCEGVDVNDGTCSLPDCDKPVKRSCLCYGHYMKQWRYGTPTPVHPSRATDLTGRRFGHLVAVERVGNRWLCRCDCGRTTVVRVGDLNRGSAASCGDRRTHRRQDEVGYSSAHDRVRRDRGLVQRYDCVDCGARAQHWSYDHADPDELHEDGISARPVAYSLKPEHYQPRCISCHKRFDLGRHDAA